MSDLMRLDDLVPDYYEGIFDMDVIMQVEQPILDDLQALIDQTRDNQFAILADEQGISIFESMLGITGVAGQDLETRRYNVILQLLPPKPVTMAYMRDLIAALNIDAELIVDGANFHVEVEAHTTDNNAMNRLSTLLNKFLPANLTFTTFNLQTTSTVGTALNGTDALYSTNISNKGGTE
jgi:hypothetical protein